MPHTILQLMFRFTFASALTAGVVLAQAPSLFSGEQERLAKTLQMTGQVSVLRDSNPWVL